MASPVETVVRGIILKGLLAVAAFNRSLKSRPTTPHPFLSGIHRPMDSELTLTTLQVQGEIPPELNGSYLRIGPNPIAPPNPAVHHWFDGDGMVHGVRIQGGKALWYRNRWVRSTAVSKALSEPEVGGLRHPPSDNVNTNVMGHAGKIWALVEAGASPVELSPELDTVAHNPFGGTLRCAFSAHPHRCPDTGELHAITYDGPSLNTIHHVVVDSAGKVRREEPIAVQHGPSVHDCALTARFVIVLDLPVTFSMRALLGGHYFPYTWNPRHRARVGLLPREGKGSDTLWCEVEPCYAFHPCNAYDTDDGKVVMDLAVHDTMFAHSTQGPDSTRVTFERWTLDPATGSVARKVIDAQLQEFPRCDERRTGKPYRYAYAMPLARGGGHEFVSETHLIKHDLMDGTRQVHDFGAHRYPGEFVFVPRSPDAAEDDGWLMGLVINMDTQTTDLVILDAQEFDGLPQAVITIPHRVPPGFHGNWVGAIAAG